MPLGPLSQLPPQINKELVFWSSHPAIKCSWNWPIYSEKTGRRGAERLSDGWRNWTNFHWLTEISAMVLAQSFFSGGSKCLLYPFVLPVPGPSSSGCRQLPGFHLQPLFPDKFNYFPDHFWFQRSVILFSSSTHADSSRPRNEPSNFKGRNCTHILTLLRMRFAR